MLEDNIGFDLGFDDATLLRVFHMDSLGVAKDARGKGLQNAMVRVAEDILSSEEDRPIFLSTISPKNTHSLNNFLASGYRIVKRKKKYGGHERVIVRKG